MNYEKLLIYCNKCFLIKQKPLPAVEKIKTLSYHPGSLKFSSKFQLIKVGKLKQQKVFHVITTKVSLVVFTRNSFNNWKKNFLNLSLINFFSTSSQLVCAAACPITEPLSIKNKIEVF